ncbi:alpha/beta fold hydrolase [Woodsholea maritima]|uniref:alpha/beta fold hydrolase n=1 Tax=Woodsholea maritima TaxID=240237 RepID=UPI00036C3420|nr:alpha/beta hydrolase [Woodsholea maritima]
MEARVLELQEARLHYIETGDPQQQSVVILHGAISNLRDPYLALNGHLNDFHAIYLDRPGLGHSTRPPGPWTPQREAQLITDFMAAKGLKDVLIVGHSWGGAIAMRCALDHPHLFKGQLLIAPALRAGVGEAAWYNKATHWPLIGWLISHVVAPLLGPLMLGKGVAHAFHPEPVPASYIEDSDLALILHPRRFRANARDMADVNAHLAAQETRYPELSVPTVILAAPHDQVLWTARHSGALDAVSDQVHLTLIDGAGHNLHFSHQGLIVEALNRLKG